MCRLLCLLFALALPASANLCRNGSFEGSTLYWHNVRPDRARLVEGDATVGRYSLRLEQGWVMSAPVVCQPGQPYTVSFDVKGDRAGEVRVQMPPSAREVGQQAKRLWTAEARQTAAIGPAWQRVSFTAPADVPQTGFWPDPHYMVMIEGSVPLQIDGVVIEVGDQGAPAYRPRRAVEVLSDCPDLPGYATAGNLLTAHQPVRLTALAGNPGETSRQVTLRWQLIDYEGVLPVGEPREEQVDLPAGGTVSRTVTLPLSATGTVLARVQAIVDGEVVDQSDLPLTSLPYPTGPRQPNLAERFGGSFFNAAAARRGSQLGLSWTRWFPHTKWQDHQPDGPETFRWFDAELDLLEELGVATHLVLYGWPKWIMDQDQPLPRDMRWPADDPRWEDLTIETAWDRYLKACAEHYRGRHVVFELENEPELDKWHGREMAYAKFTIRSAQLLKQVDPGCKVMVNNVYGIPSSLNRVMLEQGGAKYLDIISWHDYHAGWLTDAVGIQRMRAALDALGGQHLEIWFNEGWAFTNTAVDEPPACTGLTSAESTNDLVASVAQMTVAGQAKTILFHTGYAEHGMSFWDYSGPGTMLWDWYDYPLPIAAAWNVLCHHLGLSDPVGLVRPPGADLCIFQDHRNGRGVIVAHAARGATEDVTLKLPLSGLMAEDLMGNARPLNGPVSLPANGRSVYLYAADKRSGQTLHDALEPLDRRHTGFVTDEGRRYTLPPAWVGVANGSAEGNPALADGQPIWRLEQVWPPNPTRPEHYRPLVWRDGWWVPVADAFGGQPKVEQRDTGLRIEFRAAHGNPSAERIAGLVFRAPEAGTYTLTGTATARFWDGNNPLRLSFLRKGQDAAVELQSLALKAKETVGFQVTAELAAAQELVLLPRIAGQFTGGDVTLAAVEIRRQ